MDNRPIGMFDSGSGGLTVLKEYIKEMPNESFVYYGDTAHLPYGDKSKEKIIEYSKEIIDFLLKKDVKLIVIACGTASAAVYDDLKNKYKVPIMDIITPTAKVVSSNNVGVIATKSTINSSAWESAIKKFNPNCNVTSVACPLFVPIVEEGFANSKISNLAVKEYISKFKRTKIDSLIMGCTHYPIIEKQIQKAVGKKVKLINAGKISAIETKKYLEEHELYRISGSSGKREFYSSDDFETFKRNAKTLGIDIE